MTKHFRQSRASLISILGLIIVLLIAGCSSGGSVSSTAPTQTTTLIYYAFGANDLQPYMADQLAQLESIGSNANLNILIARGGGESWPQTEGYYVTPEHTQEQIFSGTAVAIDQESTLSNFITTAMESYPADRYMLVFSGHAGGINSTIGHMKVANMLKAIAQVKTNLGSKYINLDLVGFDNCLMSDSEVAAGLAPYANYLVASQNFDYSWRNNVIFGLLAEEPNISTVNFAKFIIDDYFVPESSNASTLPVRTLALTDLSQSSDLVASVNNFATQLAVDYANGTNWLSYATALNKSTSFYTDPFLSATNNSLDLLSMVNNSISEFSDDSLLYSLGSSVESAVYQAVIYKRNGDSKFTANAGGLNIYAPVIVASATTDYAANTNGLFAVNYVNFIDSYTAYYQRESTNLIANVGDTSYSSGIYTATVGNPVSLAQAVALFGYESLPVFVYSATTSSYESSIVTAYIAGIEAGFESPSITYSTTGSLQNTWLWMVDASGESYPVIALPDSNDYTVNGYTYNIPAALIADNNVSQVGYLVASKDDDGVLHVNTFVDSKEDSSFSTGQSFIVESGAKYVPMAYVWYVDKYVYAIPQSSYATPLTAPFSFNSSSVPLNSYTNSGSEIFTFFSTDVTGAKNISRPYTWQ